MIDIYQQIDAIEPVSKQKGIEALAYIHSLTKPMNSLGEIEKIAVQLSEITTDVKPEVFPPGVIVFAADHGVAEEGVSAYPQEVTAQMVNNFLSGGAAINVFTKRINGLLEIVDAGVKTDIPGVRSEKIGYGTKNFAVEPAMTRKEAIRSLELGMERAEAMIKNGARLLILGEMGIGNTTSSSAIAAALSVLKPEDITGRGTGIESKQVAYKAEVIKKALNKLKPDANDPIDVLSKVGGFEIGAMTGAMLYAASKKIPVILDGFICTTAALVASKLNRHVRNYMIAGHLSVEPGHLHVLNLLGKKPLVSLGMRLGEGTGAVLVYPLIEAAAEMVKGMATFDTAGVSKERTIK
ncbi:MULTISPECIES: nicotinate-nucleotide--dimethylbenzimidazole phosphoribosyltransferase [Metabacillus]|uniref:Nicotinate-nucleotide--dimethylbenzimidazole phosphoribosyltransferase n=1 Tax=Metabacillus hrfriensis TaxID=3048891 RepID=A0ACD4RIF4_9BACI|nr:MULTISPECIES: nicotinate-nucleotide--dimethylbenzimidazole phosphoribosyltransferase [Metabacillus]UAL54533.1 nicotinate-nucleotide--dimethylbenzimidazole phosphoribosyltransferase [Metabacillus dongyingensis]USK30866.1 nicotinate-nucleotide--dimethylbenzimidazole phosphoribosyltransferase [Bacillus sp. CMF21]WHZ60114.1 nicotinate-nucleotide--dimethylbenzimidazole phosphoribosyltransferase [Metabacillus sp. CT-WN-B3]